MTEREIEENTVFGTFFFSFSVAHAEKYVQQTFVEGKNKD